MTCVTSGGHEWEPEYMDIEYDDHMYLYQPCSAVEITGSYTCDRLDETFYEEGRECEAQRTVTYGYEVYEIGMHGPAHIDLGKLYDVQPTIHDRLLDAAADELLDQMLYYDADLTDPDTVEIDLTGTTYRVTFEHVETAVSP